MSRPPGLLEGPKDAMVDALSTARAIRAGRIGVVEAVDEAIRRAEDTHAAINAIVAPDFDRAREQAKRMESVPADRRGPLFGVPTLYKDLFCPREGDTAYQGNRVLAKLDHRHEQTSSVARRLDAAGAVSIGRSHSPEFGCGNCTAAAETELYGPTRNPWDLSRTPMGSSGGAAAAVAAGVVPFAQASDGGGSIRMPASACGLVGLKPSRARVSSAPAGEGWAGGVSEGIVARSVRDAALGLDVLAGLEVGDPYGVGSEQGVRRGFLSRVHEREGRLRVGLCPGLPYVVHNSECARAVEVAGQHLEALGHGVDTSHPAEFDRLDYMYDYITVIRTSLAVELSQLARTLGRAWSAEDVEDGTWVNYQRGLKVSAVDYATSVGKLHQWTRDVMTWWTDYDLLVMPTLATPPPEVGFLVSGDDRQRRDRLAATIPYTPQFNVTGQPAISLPIHVTNEGWPVGAQLIAKPGREGLLLSVSHQLEGLLGWTDRRPPNWVGS